MADIRPFAGLRYARASLSALLCPPYDVIAPEQARRLRAEPLNAVHLELPEGEGPARYRCAAKLWRSWRENGVLKRDPEPALYAVEERFALGGRDFVRRGFLAALGVSAQAARSVVPHERTLPKPKEDRLELLSAVGANVSPIFAVFPDRAGAARRALLAACRGKPAAAGRTASGVSYHLWTVDDGALGRAVAKTRSAKVLIADGHHRFEVGREFYRRRGGRGASTILAYFCPDGDPGLAVLPTHRVVAAGAVAEAALARFCALSPARSRAQLLLRLEREANPYAFGVFAAGRFRLAVPRSPRGCRSGLCVEWLGRVLLRGVAPDRIRYSHDAGEAQALARQTGGAAVFVKPCTVAQIRRAVERVGLLPPKSTYFYPKIATGLVFKSLEDA